MTDTKKGIQFSHLQSRAVLSVSGEDRVAFLQGIVSNDVEQAAGAAAVWAALLTPQGKYLHDFFVVDDGDVLRIDCEADRSDDLYRRLSRYRLRSKVTLSTEPEISVLALWGDTDDVSELSMPVGGKLYRDPRLPAAGWRCLVPAAELDRFVDENKLTAGDYDAHRVGLGLPDGSRDMEVEKTILLEAGFHELHGVDWNKGCYMGQELTARTYYRGLIKKRLVPVTIDGSPPQPGEAVVRDGRTVGEIRSVSGQTGIALLRIDEAGLADPEPHTLHAGSATLTAQVPEWMILSPSAKSSDAAE